MNTQTGTAARKRGVVLVIVAALILVVAIGTFMMQRMMRQRYLEAHRYTFGETALHLAESGINLSIEHLREASLNPGEKFYDLLVESGFEEINGIAEPIEAPYLESLVKLLGKGVQLDVKVEFRNFQPFYGSTGLRGVAPDPREKFGELAVVSRASYRGVVRSLVAAKQVKVVNVTAPVLSKFSLFVRSLGGQNPNLLGYNRLTPASGFHLQGGEPGRPLVVYARSEKSPAVVDGRFDSLATVLEEQEADAGGLIFLGGDEPWNLNLVHGIGAGPFEELFHLRRTRYQMDSHLPGVTAEHGLTFGFYDGIFKSAKFGSATGDPGRFPAPGGGVVSGATSALHLYGDVDNVTPVPVLGPVFRNFVTLHLLDGLWYPYRTRSEFASMPGQERFRGSYDEYAQVMVRVENEPYNRSYDYIFSNTEALVDGEKVAAVGTPFLPPAYLTESLLGSLGPAVDGDEYFLYPESGQVASGFACLRRNTEGEAEEIFRGSLNDLDGDLLETLVTAKATYGVENAAVFFERFLEQGEIHTPGILWVKHGDLELEAITSSRGVMVVVAGNLTLKGAVTQGENQEPITLVSLGGDIRIQTTDKIQASLVALRGRVRSRGKLEIQGAVAAETLDLGALISGEESKSITYDPSLDSTDPVRYRKQLQVAMDQRIRLYLEGH
jgi:hypothetical protein